MRLPLDPPAARPTPAARIELENHLADARFQYLDIAPPDPTALRRIGLAVLDHLELRLTDVWPSVADCSPGCERVGRRFLEHVLPDPDEVGQLGAEAAGEYLAGLRAALPDVGRLMAGYGAGRRAFAGDRRLKYRSGGYRGRAGEPLADHIIAAVVRTAAAPQTPAAV